MKVVFECWEGNVELERVGDALWVIVSRKEEDEMIGEAREIPYEEIIRAMKCFDMSGPEVKE